ncbi:MAG: hypothetical protein LUG94_01735 [Ruminococcus sp.]|nr:hypothetical protein [Ruminococcus sp.]
MQNKKMYFSCVILSIVMVFLIIALHILLLFKYEVMSGNAFSKAIDSENIPSVVYNYLNDYFEEQYNSTGIPTDIYMQSLTEDDISNIVNNSVNNALEYMSNKDDSFNIDYDFSNLETSLNDFFVEYAQSIDYPQDDEFYSKVESTTNNAISVIKEKCDVFKFSTINDTGLFDNVRKYYHYIDYVQYALIGAIIILILILILLNRKYILDCIYWLCNSISISSILMLIPCIYIKSTDYFSSFSIKTAGTYNAVTGLLNGLTDTYITTLIITLAIGLIGVVITLVTLKKRST